MFELFKVGSHDRSLSGAEVVRPLQAATPWIPKLTLPSLLNLQEDAIYDNTVLHNNREGQTMQLRHRL